MLSVPQMQQLEREAFERGVSAADLMEEAGRGLAAIVRQFFPKPATCLAFCGKGNNAGDALVALRMLCDEGWEVAVDLAFEAEEFSELSASHFAALAGKLSSPPRAPVVVLDGLLGLGAKGDPRGPIVEAIERLNVFRDTRGSWVLAIDLPSGLDGETGRPGHPCVRADLTATIAVAKDCLVRDGAVNQVGRLAVVPLDDLRVPVADDRLATPDALRAWLPRRPFDTHKGMAGRIGIVAGSHGATGAARMASMAAVKGGGGLVTLYAKPEVAELLATACIPEVMVKEVASYRDLRDEKVDCWAVGSGLGHEGGREILSLVRDAPQPMVVDADALNAIASDITLLKHCRGPRLLTPHPGEMERLFPQGGRSRLEWLDAFLREYPVTLLLKGARTIVGSADGPERYFNTTGDPGMASGGMGDVLSGLTAALWAQTRARESASLLRAGILGAWLSGRAAELALSGGEASQESLSAVDVIDHLGRAFGGLSRGY